MARFVSALVEGVSRLVEDLLKRRARSQKKDNGICTVGYSAPYAIYVHEDLQANHPNGGQAKFLERPARQMRNELGTKIRGDAEHGIGLKVANLNAAKALLAASQPLVPVDTGALKASGFVQDAQGNTETAVDLGLAEEPKVKRGHSTPE